MSVTASTYANCVLWIDPSTGVTASSSRVSAVADQSVAANNLAQATSGLRPYYAATTPASIQFDRDASNNTRRLDPPSGLSIDKQAASFFVVVDFNTLQSGDYQAIIGQSGGTVIPLFMDTAGKTLGINWGGVNVSTLRPTSSKVVIGVVASPSALTLYCNGQSQTFSAASPGSFTGIQIGAGGTSYRFFGNLYRFAYYNRALTGTEAGNLMAGLMADFGITATPDAVYGQDGDSISTGYATLDNACYVRSMGLSSATLQYDVAVPATQISGVSADSAAQVDTLYQSGKPFVLGEFVGRNDIYVGGSTGATVYSSYKTLLAARRTARASAKILAFTVIGTSNANKDSFNALLKADFTAHPNLPYCYVANGVTYADLLVDVGAVPGIVLPDGVHPDSASQVALGAIVGPAVRSLLITGYTLAMSGTGLNATATITATTADAVFDGTQSVTVAWGDGNTSVITPTVGNATGSANHSYATAGSKTITPTNVHGWTDDSAKSFLAVSPDVTAPTITGRSIDTLGTTLSLTFSESVTGVAAADYALSGGATLSAASGSGTAWTMTISPAVTQGATRTLSYSGTTTKDAANNLLATFSGAAITNNSTVPGSSNQKGMLGGVIGSGLL